MMMVNKVDPTVRHFEYVFLLIIHASFHTKSLDIDPFIRNYIKSLDIDHFIRYYIKSLDIDPFIRYLTNFILNDFSLFWLSCGDPLVLLLPKL